jgi:peptide chain release factor 1
MREKVERLLKRLDEVEAELSKPDLVNDRKLYRDLMREHSYLAEIRDLATRLFRVEKELADNRTLLYEEKDPEFLDILREEIGTLEQQQVVLDEELRNLLVPPDPLDHRNTIIEIRAGTGGDEAALFVGDCVRMYSMYADSKGWKREVLSSTPSERGGFKEYVMVISGRNVHRLLQYEGGTHRVQRVPETEAKGRIHTSAITIAVLPEPEEEEEVRIDEKELRIDTYRSSGAGGQHVNVTDSAVRITHLPTNIVVSCQDERSQIKNREKAMRILQAKLNERERLEREAAIASQRASQVGSGDRSERIRTYNFPQNRVTDHRINLTKYNLSEMMNGDLDGLIAPLVIHFYQRKLSDG